MGSQSAEWIMNEEEYSPTLSQENINKLNSHALYKCKPSSKYRGSWYETNLFHCCNWTFKVRQYLDGGYYMQDTYWGASGDSLSIELTDENFDEFELIADMRDLKQIKEFEVKKYREEDVMYLAVDSGGIQYGKHFLKKDAKKNKDKILDNLDYEIDSCKRKLESLQRDKEMILNSEDVPDWY